MQSIWIFTGATKILLDNFQSNFQNFIRSWGLSRDYYWSGGKLGIHDFWSFLGYLSGFLIFHHAILFGSKILSSYCCSFIISALVRPIMRLKLTFLSCLFWHMYLILDSKILTENSTYLLSHLVRDFSMISSPELKVYQWWKRTMEKKLKVQFFIEFFLEARQEAQDTLPLSHRNFKSLYIENLSIFWHFRVV